MFDVRTPEEYAAGHLPGARSAPGGQLVQETDHQAAVRGARIVLCDTDGTRANMSASWLAQMGWEVYVVAGLTAEDFTHTDTPPLRVPETQGKVTSVKVEQVKAWLADRNSHTVVLDFSTSAQYIQGHIHSAWWVLRTQLADSLKAAHKGYRYVLTCDKGHVSRFAVADVQALGGTAHRMDNEQAMRDWQAGRELTLPFFKSPSPEMCLWRLSLPRMREANSSTVM